MKLLIHPPVEVARLDAIRRAAAEMEVVNAADEAEAKREIAAADAFFGKLTPELLAAATRLRWVQSPTASLEHYLLPALVEHPLQSPAAGACGWALNEERRKTIALRPE